MRLPFAGLNTPQTKASCMLVVGTSLITGYLTHADAVKSLSD